MKFLLGCWLFIPGTCPGIRGAPLRMNVAATQCMSSLILVRSPQAEVQFAGGEGDGTINEGFVERPSHKYLTDLKEVECDGLHTCGPPRPRKIRKPSFQRSSMRRTSRGHQRRG